MLVANVCPYRMFQIKIAGAGTDHTSMQLTGDVVPSFAAPARPGWRTVLGRLVVIAVLVLQGVRLGLAFRTTPLPALIGGALLVCLLVGVLSIRKMARDGVATPAGATRYLARLLLSVMVFLSVGVLVGRAIPDTPVRTGLAELGSMPIPGAPGYTTYYGRHGLPLAVGHPWGKPCTPVRFIIDHNVSTDIRVEVTAVVAEARRDGLNVTLQDDQGMWIDNSVYYPPGMTTADVANFYIGVTHTSGVRLASGRLSQILQYWGTAADGTTEHFTSAQAQLELPVVGGNPWLERVSVREMVGESQGIHQTPLASSGMVTGTTVDTFSPSDISAMQLMSGCGALPLETVTNPFFNPAGNP